jgi:hypothetical protein
MHTLWVRLHAVVFFGLSALLGFSCLAALSKFNHSSKPGMFHACLWLCCCRPFRKSLFPFFPSSHRPLLLFSRSRRNVEIEQIKVAQTARGCGSGTVVVRLDRGLATGLSLVRYINICHNTWNSGRIGCPWMMIDNDDDDDDDDDDDVVVCISNAAVVVGRLLMLQTGTFTRFSSTWWPYTRRMIDKRIKCYYGTRLSERPTTTGSR